MIYHDATFELLSTRSQISATAVEELMAAEQRLKIRLPASLREWYSAVDAVTNLAKHSNDDPPVPVRAFAIRDTPVGPVLPIRQENQGVCTWAVSLDGSDDPPVLLDDDLDGGHWRQVSPTFSAYVRTCVWDYRVVLGLSALVAAQNGPISPRVVAHLRRLLVERESTFVWPGDPAYRFEGTRFGVLIWANQGQADWFVGAADPARLVEALRLVWESDAVGPNFYDCSDMGRVALDQVERDAVLGDSP